MDPPAEKNTPVAWATDEAATDEAATDEAPTAAETAGTADDGAAPNNDGKKRQLRTWDDMYQVGPGNRRIHYLLLKAFRCSMCASSYHSFTKIPVPCQVQGGE
jgi:hypothetical protein